ncbi:HelD family protein [Millisia brevis]|uniref:HelD family protein n=1 Tax=Millisia brevis TaxID=264148 RepID=UPI000AA5AFDA
MPDGSTNGPTAVDVADDAAPAVVDEQAHLDRLYEHLDRMRAYARRRLDTVLLETGGTPQARTERESFTAMYSDDLTRYDAAENGLCFGRIDMSPDAEDESGDGSDSGHRHIGRIGILDEDNDYDSLLFDWRAPLARPFYLATTANPDGVTRRRHIRSRRRRVTEVNDEFLDPNAYPDAVGDAAGGMAGEGTLLSALNAARTGHMNDIVETIQREQDTIIRSTHRGVLVVQGGPGTGKTAVALHRAAYLLYTYRKQLDKAGVLVIGPNATFLDYIGQVLPALGETGVLLATIGTLYPGVTPQRVDPPRARELKGSLQMAEVLSRAIRNRQEIPDTPIDVVIDGVRTRVDRKLATRARGRARSSRRPHNSAREIFVAVLIDGLADQYARAIGTDVVDGGSLLDSRDLDDIRSDLREDPAVARVAEDLWPELSAQDALADLLASPEALRAAAPDWSDDDIAAVTRTDDGTFSEVDPPLLDELAELLGINDDAVEEQRRRQWRARIEEAQGALDILTGSAPQDLDDGTDPEILMAYDLIDAEQLAERTSATYHRTTAERAAGDRTWVYGHVIVDEAQELSEMAWRMVMRRIPNHWMTLVGDVAQTSEAAGTSSWRQVLEPYVAQRWQRTELTVNYRTPSSIMAIAADVLATIDPTLEVPRSIRHNGSIPGSVHVPADELVARVAALVADQARPGLVAVIAAEADLPALADVGDDRTTIATVADIKGLEFDAVIVVNPDAILDASSRGANDLYVALTRATQRLLVVHSAQLPECLGNLTPLD